MTSVGRPARLLPGTEPALDAARLRVLSDAAACLVGTDVAEALAELADEQEAQERSWLPPVHRAERTGAAAAGGRRRRRPAGRWTPGHGGPVA